MRKDLALISEWIAPGSHVLDLGCGDGTLLAYLREHRRVTGYGLEIDDENILKCLNNNVQVIQTDLDQGLSDFNNNSFDYVMLTQTLQAIHRPDKLLQEMLRVGREAIVTLPNFGHWAARWQMFFGGRMPISRALPDKWFKTQNIRLCTLKDFEGLCEELGIEILQCAVVDSTHHTPVNLRLLPNLLGEIALYRFRRQHGREE